MVKTERSNPAGDVPATASVRDRILNTARELFYREGARAIGVDTVVAQSGVAKTSLYRWFSSKDVLIAAVLEQEVKDRWAGWDINAQRAEPGPRAQLRAQMAGIARFCSGSRFRGCPFVNVSVEFPDPEHPARAIAYEMTQELTRRLRSLVDQLDVRDAAELSEQLVLLVEGSFSAAQILGKNGPQKYLVAAAEALVEAQLKPKRE